MTLQSVSIIGPNGETLNLTLQDQNSSYFVKEILGLDPVNATIASTSFGTVDGAQYVSSRLEARNIVLTLGFNPDYSTTNIAKLRTALYRKMLPKLPVTLIFTSDDAPQVKTLGRIETFESPSFTKDPEARISVLCFDPDFYSTTVTNVNMSSNTNAGTNDTIVYSGAAPTGFKLFLYPNRSISAVNLYVANSYNEVSYLAFSGPLLANDVVEISTIPGEKGVWLTRSPAAKTSVLYYLGVISSWPRLTPGNNLMRVFTDAPVIPCKLEYTEKYGGL